MMKSAKTKLNRRHLVATGLSALALAALPQAGLALTDNRARQLIDQVVGEINKVIASGKSESAMIADFQRIFQRYADVDIIARSTLGADSKRASNSQIRAFTAAFEGYISRKYGKRFREFIGGKVEVVKVGKVKSWYEVLTMVTTRGYAPYDVRFLVSDRSGKDKFFDMVIEGISLRLTERTEIGAMLDQRNGNIDALIADLKRAG